MELFLTPSLTAGLVYLVGLAIAIGYLLYLPQKMRDSKLILALMLAWFANAFNVIVYQVTHTHLLIAGPGFDNAPLLTYVFGTSQLLFQLFLVILLFRIGFPFSRWEEKLLVAIIALLIVYSTIIYALFLGDADTLINHVRLTTQATIALNGWVAFAGIRKLWLAYSKGHDFRSKRLVTMMVLTSISSLIFFAAGSYITVIWPFSAELRGVLPALLSVAVAGFLIIGYLLYGTEKHTLLVKLVGFLVIAYIAVFSTVIPFMRTEVSLRQSFLAPDGKPSLVFSPDSLGGYLAQSEPPRWLEPSGDAYLVDDDDAILVRSAFAFPFFGASYDSIWVGTNGSISFGRELDADNTFSSGLSFYDDTPSAMPLYSDLTMAGGDANIQVDATASRYLVTWNRVSLYDLHESTVTMQAALYPDGTVEFNYADLTTIPLLNYQGISPGGSADSIELSGSSFQSMPNQAVFEYQDIRDAYRRFVHPLVVSVTWIGIVGLFLVLVLGIAFYRAGILNPLKRVLVGLGAVEQGDLEAEVVITEKNELGALADYFNRMTKSLREYAQKMEELVAQRTTDLDKTILDLRATQAQLVEQEKLASLGSLTAGIAHEIKNPLNFVNNFAEVSTELVEELSEAISAGQTEEAQSILDAISENAVQIAKHGRRADSIVKSMMQHARGGTSVPENIYLNAFLGEYIDLAWHGRRAREPEFQTEVIRRFDEAVGEVHIQPQELGRVILNLLNNAFDALKETDPARVTVTTLRTEGRIEIVIEDNGSGIPEEIRERIFEPFFTTKASGEGTGLGLSLSYDIVTKGHGGTMRIESSQDAGARFVITLPG